MKEKYDMMILIGMGVSVIFAISTIVSYVLSQVVPEVFTSVMEFSLVGVLFGGGLVAIGHILSIGKTNVTDGVEE